MITVGIAGGAGYTGGELLRIIINHPNVDIKYVYSTSQAGNPVSATHKDLLGETDLIFSDKLIDVDVLFLCLPHGASKTFLTENNIAENVCYKRLKNVINGYKPKGAKEVQPLPSNLRYFKTKLIPKEKTDLSKKKISKELEDLICIKEDFFNLFKEHEGFKVFTSDSGFLALIFDLKFISEAKKILKDLKGDGILYVFSLSHDDFKDDFEDVKNISRIENFPTPLIHLYNQIHR